MAFEEKMVKEPTKVMIYLENCKITGTIYLPLGERLSDYINSRDVHFIPITDATVESIDVGGPMGTRPKWSYKVKFMDLNKDYIISIFPVE